MSKYDMLNPPQKEATFYTDGPLLILAGAGSGKTRVLTHRAAFLVEQCGVNPFRIMAITFTNKAAFEMRERISHTIGQGADALWVRTFHSSCVRILRRYIDRIGYSNNFSIYDADDQKNIMKDICKRLEINTKMYKERMFLNTISTAKNELITPEEFALETANDFGRQKQAQVYKEYQRVLKKNDALDFDDLIFRCVELLRKDEEVRTYYQERFQYIMVDEYQDTNTAQFELVRLLSGKYRNLCVVGDDDQSIYKFRGANIQNILNFEKYFPDAKIIKLEQNYRSTQNILDAANSVIQNNQGRKEKHLWTEQKDGAKINFYSFQTAYDEAEGVVRSIAKSVRERRFSYGETAILYRTNAQSRLLEEKMVGYNIPYKIVGGVNFYSRREIKDVLAYLKTIDNASDDLSVKRIINVPKRGIGATTIQRVQAYADVNNLNFFEALMEADRIPSLGKSAGKLTGFVNFIRKMRALLQESTIHQLVDDLLEETGYIADLEAQNEEEATVRIENIEELQNKIIDYEEQQKDASLSSFLDEVSLVADIDSVDDNQDYVVLMTLHSAKGLEFPQVYMTGMEDGLFPSYMCITSEDATELEEERRLCYVGITRAMRELTLTCAQQRMVRGETQFNKVSRFIKEIPKELLNGSANIPKETGNLFQKENGYRTAKKAFHSSDSYGLKMRNFGNQDKLGNLDYQEEDRVVHSKFGEGTVLNIVSGGRDYEVTVEFDKAGVRKMFALFAKLKKV